MRKTLKVWVGNVDVGGGAPCRVQSMTKSKTEDFERCIKEIKELESVGCEIVRVAVPKLETLDYLKKIKKESPLPIIADVHFSSRIAIRALEIADGIRINPGNIKSRKVLKEIAKRALDLGRCVRIGVNSGSIDERVRKRCKTLEEAMVESARETVELFEDEGMRNIKVSLKASSPQATIKANRIFSSLFPYPLHIGLTEAGPPLISAARSGVSLGELLREGIGETIRVSITGPSKLEVKVAYEILRATGVRNVGPEIISCPTCGRCEIDLPALVEEVERALSWVKKPIKVAVMGCIVNGPGEAREADVGIAGGKGVGILFSKGKMVKKLKEKELVPALIQEVERILQES